jgi:asparagine synthase (glutamine-hydrolysing)
MPGIAGIISKRSTGECEEIVRRMVTSMEHERSNTSGCYSIPELGVHAGWIAHEDSFVTSQPFVNETGDVALLLSGECFIDPETRAELRRRGHRINSNNDWLVHLYEEEGDRFFEKLNGLFSGVLIDKRRNQAFLFNDRYGSERIYWCQTRDATYFASEAKAILCVVPETRAFDARGIADFLSYECTLEGRTLFQGIQLLPGASVWSYKDGQYRKRKYFSPQTWEAQSLLSEEEFESALDEIFKRVLPRYFESQGKIGISLTGGLDSRMIMACLPQTRESPVSYTFTGKEHETLDDRIAAQVANACGVEYHLLRLHDNFFSDFASHADRTVYVTDGSFGVMGAHEIYFNTQARLLAPVRLTGVFGSEILRHVHTFKPVGLSQALIAAEFGQLASDQIREFAADGAHPAASAAFKTVPWNLFGTVAASRSQVVFRTPYLDNEIVALAFRRAKGLRRSPRPALRLLENNRKVLRSIPTNRRIEAQNAGLIARLKRSFFEASFKLDYLHNEGMPDWLLPFDPVLERIDTRVRIFGHHKFLHYRSWFKRELADYVQDVVATARTRAAAFWNPDFLKKVASDHIHGRKNYVLELNAVLTLEAVERLLLRDTGTARHTPDNCKVLTSVTSTDG